MYKVIVSFVDLQDNNFVYKVGDTFPRKGKRAGKERLKELATTENRRGVALIKEIKKTPNKNKEKNNADNTVQRNK